MMLSRTNKSQPYLNAMGIQIWLERGLDQPVVSDSTDELLAVDSTDELLAVDSMDELLAVDSMDLLQLSDSVNHCQRCELSALGSQKAFSMGTPATLQWLIIGDTPTLEGLPFSAASSGLFRDMLLAVDKKITSSYLTTSVKCVQNQRFPSAKEHQCCRTYLIRQIELVKPELVLVLGELAAQSLLSSSDTLDELRGKSHTLKGVDAPVIVSYHPDEVLRGPLLKKLVWQDLQMARRLVLA
jgi:uracil-DNA glycosylase family 4